MPVAIADVDDMSGDSVYSQLVDQLAALHRGRGIRRVRLVADLKDPLRRALGVGVVINEAETVRQIFATLKDATRGLPEDLRYVFLAAVGIGSTERLLGERLEEVSRRLDRGTRTVQRRLADANALLAAVLERRLQRIGTDELVLDGWYIDAMTSRLRLDGSRPEFLGRREIVATQRVHHIIDTVSIPRNDRGDLAADIEIVAVDGCTLTEVERTSASAWRYRLDLTAALTAGDRHTYAVAIRLPSDDFIRPYAVIVPIRDCREFSATVVFHPNRLPNGVWRVDALLPAALDDAPNGPPVTVQGGTATATLHGLRRGFAYGLRWTPARSH